MGYLRTDETSSILHQSPGRTGSREDKHWLTPSRVYLRTCAHSPSSKNAHSLEPGLALHPAALHRAVRLDCEIFSCLNAARPQETIEARRAWLALLENAFPTSLHSAELAICGVFRATQCYFRVPRAFNGSLPLQTGELCYCPSPYSCLSSVVMVPAYYDAPLIPTDTLVSEKRTSKQIAAFSSPLLSQPHSFHPQVICISKLQFFSTMLYSSGE